MPVPFTIDEQIREIRREIAMRRGFYPKWIQAGKMSQAKADEQIALLEAVVITLQNVQSRRTAETIADSDRGGFG